MVKTPKTAAPAAPKAPREPGSRQKILVFFLANMNRVIDHEEIQQASGNASEWARRTRELRDELGYQIRTDKDEPTVLKPGQYILRTDKRLPAFARNISKETRAWVLERNGYSCQMCGYGASDEDPFHPGRKIRLTMGHINDKSRGGDDSPGNLRAVCTNCNEGLQNTSPPKPDLLHLKSMIRRATVDDQKEILKLLQAKFTKPEPPTSK